MVTCVYSHSVRFHCVLCWIKPYNSISALRTMKAGATEQMCSLIDSNALVSIPLVVTFSISPPFECKVPKQATKPGI